MPLLRLLSIALCVCVGLNKLKASALLLKTSTTQHACICNTNHPQLVIFECPDRTSQIIGFLYLQDSSFSVDLSPSHCKAIAPSVISPEGWFPVIHDRKVRRWWFCLWNFLLQWTNQILIVICKWLSIKKDDQIWCRFRALVTESTIVSFYVINVRKHRTSTLLSWYEMFLLFQYITNDNPNFF